MEFEQDILVALSEPRNFSRLYHKTAKLRKQTNQTLSRESFNKALKRLVEDQIVTKKKITGREVEYSIDFRKAGDLGKKLLLDKAEDDSLTWFEERFKLLEANIDKMVHFRKNCYKFK